MRRIRISILFLYITVEIVNSKRYVIDDLNLFFSVLLPFFLVFLSNKILINGPFLFCKLLLLLFLERMLLNLVKFYYKCLFI